MSGFVAFLLLLSGMGVGTLVCGLVPLSLPLSHRMMRVLEVFGAGLLVGAAVTVVIPEGSSALFANVTPPTAATTSVYSTVLHPESAFTSTAPLKAAHFGVPKQKESWAWSFITKRSGEPSHDHDHDHDHIPDEHHTPKDKKPFTQSDAEHRLGSSILFGIVLMFVFDQFTSGEGNSSPGHSHDKAQESALPNHHHDYTATPARPRLETHRLSKSFHQKADPAAAPNALHNVSSRASFTVFDRSQHGITDADEEAQLGTAGAQDASVRTDPHRRIKSSGTASSNSDNDLPDDYDDHDAEHYQHPDLKRVSSSHASNDWQSTLHSSTTIHHDTANRDSSSAGAPLLHRHDSFASVASARPRPRRTRSMSSVHVSHATFGQALTTIVGLLIHATADGIAMGASAQSGDQTLTMIVFVAIMVHKAPAAFGLCAMLMSQRLSRTSIRKAVAVFALASPVGAVLTYALLALFFDSDIANRAGDVKGIDGKSIGTALAFSGGTFLFVAFHAVLELAGAEADTMPREDGETQILGKWLRVTLLIAGACTPRMLQSLLAGLGGSHHH